LIFDSGSWTSGRELSRYWRSLELRSNLWTPTPQQRRRSRF